MRDDQRKKEQDVERNVVKVVEEHWSGANIKLAEINDRNRDFLKGTLYFVSIYDANDVEHENYVYVKGERLTRFDNAKELARAVGKNTTILEYVENAFASTGVSGVIALIITVTICFLVFTPDQKNSDILKTLELALTTILGFYFGSARSSVK